MYLAETSAGLGGEELGVISRSGAEVDIEVVTRVFGESISVSGGGLMDGAVSSSR